MNSCASQSVRVVNLGCARNLVDSQMIAGRLQQKGFVLSVKTGEKIDAVIINTCCFIEEARRESIDTILDVLALKKEGQIKKVILAGCLVERYREKLLEELPDVDALVGVPVLAKESSPPQVSLTPPHYAYVRIAEGCCHRCSYCVIPKIKGPLTSRTMAAIIAEVEALERRGVKEINLIGQDTSSYGMDIYGHKSLSALLQEILRHTKEIQWIRLLYLYPSFVTGALLDFMAAENKICKYIDLPVQHISGRILKAMNRRETPASIRKLIAAIRKKIPGVSLRTSLIVGFPGETEKDFQELMDFIKDVRFERLGAFLYSREEGTPAYHMAPQVPSRVKRRRYDALMREQKKISAQILSQQVGRPVKVLIDERLNNKDNIYLGRRSCDAPEVDGVVYVDAGGKNVDAGDLIDVRITDSQEYDLTAKII